MNRKPKNCSNCRRSFLITRVLALAACLAAAPAAHTLKPVPPANPGFQTSAPTSALNLYRQVLQPVFDPADVHHVRGVQIDRGELHVVLTDGVIGLMRAVNGHITGAFFEGDGQLLLIPPNRAERTSLALFTHAAVLDTEFHTAYLRFFDDQLMQSLKRGFRPEGNPEQYIERWQRLSQPLAPMDSLELLQSMTESADSSSQLLHLRLAGTTQGIFDVFFNSNSSEQISVAQPAKANNADFYNVWTSFASSGAKDTQGPAVNASDYRIRSRISPPTGLEGETELTVTAQRSGQRTVLMQLSRQLKVSEVTLDGQPVEFIQNEAVSGSETARRGNDLVAVVLPVPLEKARPVKLLLRYAGPVMFDTGGGLIYVGSRGTWYPSLSAAFANFDLTFEYPSGWTLVATGRRVSASTQNGLQTAHFISDKPIAHAGFNLGKFETANAASGNVVIDVYAARTVEKVLTESEARAQIHPDPAKEVQNIADQAAGVVSFLSRELGPFPYSHLEISQLPAALSQSWPGMIYLSSAAYLTATDRAALGVQDPYVNLLMSELMLAHEIGHQWWGDAVDWVSYRDEWMIESLANYCGAAMLERDSPGKMQLALDHYRKELLKQNANGILADAGPVTLGPRLASSRFPDAYETVLYGRGTWLIHMLRTMLRQASGGKDDALFFAALKELLAKAAGGKISTRDLQSAFEQQLPPALFYEGQKSLDWFFDSWVNGAAIPKFSLVDVQVAGAGGKLRAKGAIRQEFAAKDMVTAVPLFSQDQSGHSRFLAFVFVDEDKTEFDLAVPAGTKDVLLDPEGTVLRR